MRQTFAVVALFKSEAVKSLPLVAIYPEDLPSLSVHSLTEIDFQCCVIVPDIVRLRADAIASFMQPQYMPRKMLQKMRKSCVSPTPRGVPGSRFALHFEPHFFAVYRFKNWFGFQLCMGFKLTFLTSGAPPCGG